MSLPRYRNALADLSPLAAVPEVAEQLRPLFAWINAGGDANTVWLRDQDGRLIHRGDHGKNSEYGWHVHRIHDGALGGRYTATNIVARHWLGNTKDGGLLGALLRDR